MPLEGYQPRGVAKETMSPSIPPWIQFWFHSNRGENAAHQGKMNIGLQWFLNVAKPESIYLASTIVDLNIRKCEKLSWYKPFVNLIIENHILHLLGIQEPPSRILSALGVALFIVVWIIKGLESWNRIRMTVVLWGECKRLHSPSFF